MQKYAEVSVFTTNAYKFIQIFRLPLFKFYHNFVAFGFNYFVSLFWSPPGATGFHLEFLRTGFHRCSSLQGILHTQETIDTRRKYFITRHELTFL